MPRHEYDGADHGAAIVVVTAFATPAIPDGWDASSVTKVDDRFAPTSCGSAGTFTMAVAKPAASDRPMKLTKAREESKSRIRGSGTADSAGSERCPGSGDARRSARERDVQTCNSDRIRHRQGVSDRRSDRDARRPAEPGPGSELDLVDRYRRPPGAAADRTRVPDPEVVRLPAVIGAGEDERAVEADEMEASLRSQR